MLTMQANMLRSAFLIYLAFSVAACRTGVFSSPRMGVDISMLPKVLSISSKLGDQYTPATTTDTLLVNLPSLVE